jgi:hypothetical protein
MLVCQQKEVDRRLVVLQERLEVPEGNRHPASDPIAGVLVHALVACLALACPILWHRVKCREVA